MQYELRRLTEADTEAVIRLDQAAFDDLSRRNHLPVTPHSQAELKAARALLADVLRRDPEGCHVAVASGDELAGVSIAVRREDLWCLSLLAVHPDHQARGVGKRLLDAALVYGEGCPNGMIMASSDARAMRRYALAGFRLVPTIAARGHADRASLPGGLRSRDGSPSDIDLTIAVDRQVRGVPHGDDILALMEGGGRLLVAEAGGGRGYAVLGYEGVILLAATTSVVAQDLLWCCLAQWESPEPVAVEYLTAGQDWAISVVLAARLSLDLCGPLFLRGRFGPLAPYLPNGAYL